MTNIKFEVGYYEWHLIVNDNLYWVFTDDFLELLDEWLEKDKNSKVTKKLVQEIVEYMLAIVESWIESREEGDCKYDWERFALKHGPFSKEEHKIATKKMVEKYYAQYGD